MGVTIVIPNYNGIAYLEPCIEALRLQSFQDFSIVVVDNGSTDGSPDWIKKNFPEIHLICLKENKGFSVAVNIGIKSTKTEFVVLLNTDTIAEPQWLENLVNDIKADPKVFSCSSKMLQLSNPELIDDAGDEYTLFGFAYQIGNGLPEKRFNSRREILSSCAGAAIYRRHVFDSIGYFDESFFAYLEDVDLGYRANLFGYKNIYCPDARILHVGSATSGKYSGFKARLSARNNVLLIKKNMHYLQIVLILPFLLVGWILMWLSMRRKGVSSSFIKGTLDGFKQAKSIKRYKFKFPLIKNYIRVQVRLVIGTLGFIRQKYIKLLYNTEHRDIVES